LRNWIFFADDTILYASSWLISVTVNRLKKEIDLAKTWFDEWKISVINLKTITIIFSKKYDNNAQKIKFKKSKISWSKSFKYLGVQIDGKLTFPGHFKKTSSKAKTVKFHLFPLINSTLPITTKLHINKMFIRPIALYAAQAWATNISLTSWKKLEAM